MNTKSEKLIDGGMLHWVNPGIINLSRDYSAEGKWIDGNYAKDHKSYWETLNLSVRNPNGTDRNFPGFSIGFVPEGYGARQVTKGPIVPGPFAYSWAHSSVIDDHGGSRADNERSKAAGLFLEADIGDYLSIDGTTFRIDAASKYDRVNIKLTPAEPPQTEQDAAEQAAVERRHPNL